jgi:hypothetical protein
MSVNEADVLGSYMELLTDWGYHPRKRLPDKLNLVEPDYPGIPVATGGEEEKNFYTGVCLMAPRDTEAISEGYNPNLYTSENGSESKLESYDEFINDFLLGGGVPRASQIFDHWGITDEKEGSVVLVMEDEEWSHKVKNKLEKNDIEVELDEVYEDVRQCYSEIAEYFETYANKVLGNDLKLTPIYTHDYTDRIDNLLEKSCSNTMSVEIDYEGVTDHYFQRINMYTTPIWLDFLEEELGLKKGSLDIVDPIRSYDEFYNHESSGSIFKKYQMNYFSNENNERNILFTPPLLAPFEEGYFKENRADHADSMAPNTYEKNIRRLDPGEGEYDYVLKAPVARMLSGLPNRISLIEEIIQVRSAEAKKKPDWKTEAMRDIFGKKIKDDEVGKEDGSTMGEIVLENRSEVREDVLRRAHSAVKEDMETFIYE